MPEFTSRYTSDVEKREADIAEKIRKWKQEEEQKVIQQRMNFMDSAALSPDFGRIAAIGMGFSDRSGNRFDGTYRMDFSSDSSEKRVIETFLLQHAKAVSSGDRIASFNGLGFDYPFIYWRAIILGVSHALLEDAGIKFHPKWGLQLSGNCFDLMTIAKSRPMRGERADLRYDSMNQVCKALGLGEKLGDGKDFASLSREDKEAYLLQDLKLTMGMAKKMLPFF